MKNIILTEREIDFLNAVIEYYLHSDLRNSRVVTRRNFKFRKDEMEKLQEKLGWD